MNIMRNDRGFVWWLALSFVQMQMQMGGKKPIIDKVLLPEQDGKFLEQHNKETSRLPHEASTPEGASRGWALGDGVGPKFSIWVAVQNDTQNDTQTIPTWPSLGLLAPCGRFGPVGGRIGVLSHWEHVPGNVRNDMGFCALSVRRGLQSEAYLFISKSVNP